MKDKKPFDTGAKAGQPRPYAPPTIWALRAGIRADGLQDNRKDATKSPSDTTYGGTLYEHLFGYDPISVSPARRADAPAPAPIGAENPQLNILAPKTNFIVRDLVSEDTDDA